MIDRGVQHADVYNLLGFSLRKSGDTKTAMTFYQKALEFDPDHKGALEYSGELYVQIGDIGQGAAKPAQAEVAVPARLRGACGPAAGDRWRREVAVMPAPSADVAAGARRSNALQGGG